MKIAAFILGVALLAGCGSGVASRNPMEASVAPAPAAPLCPSQYNFEAAGAQLAWQAPTWAPANSGSPQRVTTAAVCGSYSLKQHIVLTGAGSSYGLLYSVFSTAQNMDGRTIALYLRLDPPPPADLGFRPQFIDMRNEWVGSDRTPFFALAAGWNLIQRGFVGNDFKQVMALNFQVVTNNGVSYAGDMWIDEVNW